MVITGIVLVTLIIFIIVGVTAKKNQEKKNEINKLEYQICQLNKFKGELMSHHTLEDTFKIHRQLGAMHLAWSPAICPDKYGMFRTSNIATMSMDEVFLGDAQCFAELQRVEASALLVHDDHDVVCGLVVDEEPSVSVRNDTARGIFDFLQESV